jgi:protein-S-isoprenylcysteine O-methyltransferase Ste14
LKRILLWTDAAVCLGIAGTAFMLRPRTVYWLAGLLLTTLTFPLWVTARLQLGPAFSFRAEARQLVTHGIYSRIRHPIYLFGSAAYGGAFLALQVWPVLAVWLALTPIEIVRVRREERALRARFGEAYERYCASTWF